MQHLAVEISNLPPYSPDLNPIENANAFAKLKAPIRNAAERTNDHLQHQIDNILDAFSKTKCENDFRHADMRRPGRETLWEGDKRQRQIDRYTMVAAAAELDLLFHSGLLAELVETSAL